MRSPIPSVSREPSVMRPPMSMMLTSPAVLTTGSTRPPVSPAFAGFLGRRSAAGTTHPPCIVAEKRACLFLKRTVISVLTEINERNGELHGRTRSDHPEIHPSLGRNGDPLGCEPHGRPDPRAPLSLAQAPQRRGDR